MTVVNGIGFGISGGLLIASILSTDWLEGKYTKNERLSSKDLPNDFDKFLDRNSTIQLVTEFEYSLRHLCVRIYYGYVTLPKRVEHLKNNVSAHFKTKERNNCYPYGHIGSRLPDYASEDIKRFNHVFIYMLCTVGLTGIAIVLSLIDILIPRSMAKIVVKCTALSFGLIAGICGMIGILLARIERTNDIKFNWQYGYSFVLTCTSESLLVLMILYNILEYYLRTRKRVAEDCQYLTPESYPLNTT